MALETNVNETALVQETVFVEKIVSKLTKETIRFEVLLPTRACRFTRQVTKFDESGKEVSAQLNTFDFDFAEVLGKQRNGISGMQIYAWLRAEFDERDPL